MKYEKQVKIMRPLSLHLSIQIIDISTWVKEIGENLYYINNLPKNWVIHRNFQLCYGEYCQRNCNVVLAWLSVIILTFSWFSKKQTICSKVYTFEKVKKNCAKIKFKKNCYCKHKCFCERCHLCVREIVSCIFLNQRQVTHYAWELVCIYETAEKSVLCMSHVMLKSISCHMDCM